MMAPATQDAAVSSSDSFELDLGCGSVLGVLAMRLSPQLLTRLLMLVDIATVMLMRRLERAKHRPGCQCLLCRMQLEELARDERLASMGIPTEVIIPQKEPEGPAHLGRDEADRILQRTAMEAALSESQRELY